MINSKTILWILYTLHVLRNICIIVVLMLYRSDAEIQEYRRRNNITVSCPAGFEIPKPIQHFIEANSPDYVNDILKSVLHLLKVLNSIGLTLFVIQYLFL